MALHSSEIFPAIGASCFAIHLPRHQPESTEELVRHDCAISVHAYQALGQHWIAASAVIHMVAGSAPARHRVFSEAIPSEVEHKLSSAATSRLQARRLHGPHLNLSRQAKDGGVFLSHTLAAPAAFPIF